jgi:N2,N2-dimethylguanosine tRNA methyltransferase
MSVLRGRTAALPPCCVHRHAAGAAGADTEWLQEGAARILKKGNDVFYNEAQVTNRDLSVAVLRTFLPQLAAELAAGKIKQPRDHGDRPAKRPARGEGDVDTVSADGQAAGGTSSGVANGAAAADAAGGIKKPPLPSQRKRVRRSAAWQITLDHAQQ